MNNVDPKSLRRSRLFLLLIALVFAAPMIVAGLLNWSGWQPGVKGTGQPIQPQRNFVDEKLPVQLADGNIHFAVILGDTVAPAGEIEELVYATLAEFKGAVSAEHGIGVQKRKALHYSRTNEEIALMHRLKAMLDPNGILNPGKVL